MTPKKLLLKIWSYIIKKNNILCVCQCGHTRSVSLKKVFNNIGKEAIAIGWQTEPELLKILSSWADEIYVLEKYFKDKIPKEQQYKVIVFDVGPDNYGNPHSPALFYMLKEMVERKERNELESKIIK